MADYRRRMQPPQQPPTGEIQLIADGDGLAVIGHAADVDAFLAAEQLSSTDLGLARLRRALAIGGAAAQALGEIAANSGRWVKMTPEWAAAAKKYGLMVDSETGLEMGVVLAKGVKSGIKGPLRFEKGPGSLLNPATVSNAGALMAQVAIQQAIEQITTYLEDIDAKLDDLLRVQTNEVLARLDGVDAAVREAMTVRDAVGRVSEVTWSKVQTTSTTVFEVQGFALRELGAVAQRLEREARVQDTAVGGLSSATRRAEPEIRKWLVVLARCFQLQDSIAVLELDRVLAADPEEVDRHRVGVKAAREARIGEITATTQRLLERMGATVDRANAKVLFHPAASPAAVRHSAEITAGIQGFHDSLGLQADVRELQARRWSTAAAAVRDRALEGAAGVGAGGLDAANRARQQTAARARSTRDKVSAEVAARAARLRRGDSD